MTERSIDVRGRSEIWMGSRKFFLDLYRNASREVNSDILFVVPDHDLLPRVQGEIDFGARRGRGHHCL
uniref:Uncharacterized protein n=1 Tax=Oryza glaberrima TaxID=4538 RepID=I1PAQ7_ORYGL